jgi:O-methyltransferase
MGMFFDQAGGWDKLNVSCLSTKLFFIESVGQYILDSDIPGLIAEAGVYKGGCARLLATMFPDREILLFDSFEGMQENDQDPAGGHKIGDFSDTSLDSVKNYLIDKPNCRFHQGWFPDSASFLTDETFALVHADMDYYQSTVACIETFWPRMVTGGAMIFDDYEWVACPGVKKALNEYFNDNKIKYQIVIPDRSDQLTLAYIKQ